MSRSYLRDKFMRNKYRSTLLGKYLGKIFRNRHRRDEAPKNHPSKYITTHMSADVHWLQESTSFGGHSIPSGGHRRVSGIVRANVKEETRRIIEEQLEENNTKID